MFLGEPRDVAARAIVTRLKANDAIDSNDHTAVQAELVAVLAQYEEAPGQEVGDVALPMLRARLIDALESSENVEELFIDDAMLERIISAALMDYLPAVHQQYGDVAPGAVTKTETSTTFADLGLPFPLFDAPHDNAVVDEGPCSVCGAEAKPRFETACYTCFRAGKSSHARDTELGMVRLEDATAGLTNGVPRGVEVDPRGTVPVPGEDEEEPLTRFRVDPAQLHELLRTPQYSTWQGECWLFCCGVPMVFLGAVSRDHLQAWSRETGASVEQTAERMLAPDPPDDMEVFVDGLSDGGRSMYAFRCATCDTRRAHWDMD